MGKSFSITIPGNPVPKGRPRFVTRGKFVAVYTPTKTRDAEATIAGSVFHEWKLPPLSGPLALTVEFFLDRPKCHFRTGKYSDELSKHAMEAPTSKPDLDNLAKLVMDGLNSCQIWTDDAQVVWLEAHKAYDHENPRTEIDIEELAECQTCDT